MNIIERAKELRPFIVKAAQLLEDAIAFKCPELYDEWNGEGIEYIKDYKLRFNGKVYKVITPHASQADWNPEVAVTLFSVIDETHIGTIEDPIPYDGNMELFADLYYTQDDIVYKCIRNSEVELYHALKDLVGTYVEVVN